MRVVIVPDKFKGTLTATEAAEAIARGWKQVRPNDQLDLVPMSDGGDGFGPIVAGFLGAEAQSARVVNAAHEPIDAEWWWSEARQTAVLESAKVIGLAMLPRGKFHPFQLDTLGLGQLLRHIVTEHPGARLLIGIGGSATNDAGFGMARGLGFQFKDVNGRCLANWVELDRLDHISPPVGRFEFGDVTIASDVLNPLLGPDGASRVYGPQKGVRPEDFPIADRCFERLTEIARKDLNSDNAAEPGAGAAGGLGYGLRTFVEGRFRPGFEIFSEAAGLEERVNRADLVITGEGALDRQTAMGKGTGAIAKLAKKWGKRCIALAGTVVDLTPGQFEFALGIVPELAPSEQAQRQASYWLSILSARAGSRFRD